MTKLKLGSCVVDFERCQVLDTGNVTSVEPKVMEVLQCLYQHKNHVVSQQQLFETVWGNAIFNPSSVQRSIAILRKLLEQNTKSPQFIMTHPKRGYSLNLVSDETPDSSAMKKYLLALLCCVLVGGIGGVWWVNQYDFEAKLEFSSLKPLTSSESNEKDLVISSTGDLVAFVRVGANKNNHIWLKKLSTGEELQISQVADNYRMLAWSKDGNALAYIIGTDEKDELFYINIDPYTYLASEPVKLADLLDGKVISSQLQWDADGNIYLSQRLESSITQLSVFSIPNKELKVLRVFDGSEKLYDISLSPNGEQLALIFDVHQNNYRIDVMEVENSSQATLVTIENKVLGLSWHPTNQSLLLSHSDKLKQLDMQGELTQIDFDNFHYIRNAQYTADGIEIMMELVSVDVDIMYSDLAAPNDYKILVDTQSLDFLPIYSPDDSRFAFESHRNGLKQLFVYEDGLERLVFSNPKNEELFGIVWSPDGSQVITASKDRLFVIDVEHAKYHEVKHDFGPFYLWESYSNEKALLVSRKTDEGIKPAKFNIESQQLTLLFDSPDNFECVYMGLDLEDTLYVSDQNKIYATKDGQELDVFWQSDAGNVEGFTLSDEYFSVKINNAEGFELIKVDPISLIESPLLAQNYGNDMFLTNANKNADRFLFSRVKDIKKLVRLR